MGTLTAHPGLLPGPSKFTDANILGEALIRGGPMWTSKNRARYDRSKLRYPSDFTDEEWELIVMLIPPGKSGGANGR